MSFDKIAIAKLVHNAINELCNNKVTQGISYFIAIAYGVFVSNWQYVFIGAVFTFPIIVFLIDIRYKVNKILDISDKLVLRGFNFSFDSASGLHMKMNMQIKVFNCSYSIIHFNITDKTITTIKEHVSNIDKTKGQLEHLKGFILPHQEIDINLPIIENIPTDSILKASANIVCEYGESSTILNNQVEWTLNDIELEKRNDNTYNKKSGRITKVDYRPVNSKC